LEACHRLALNEGQKENKMRKRRGKWNGKSESEVNGLDNVSCGFVIILHGDLVWSLCSGTETLITYSIVAVALFRG